MSAQHADRLKGPASVPRGTKLEVVYSGVRLSQQVRDEVFHNSQRNPQVLKRRAAFNLLADQDIAAERVGSRRRLAPVPAAHLSNFAGVIPAEPKHHRSCPDLRGSRPCQEFAKVT